ncbi:hypothetical protein [Schlesneria paludicola]|uniref:hypothetical protein n=1 Tax=Schlesneria paludicola TaxID=360056 RepID=UPI00029A310F|nr:hypothetical protein [Schlesneria paludicola]
MTLDDAYEAAARLLDERGQLLNAHLYRLVESNPELFRDVRERLIETGIAEDRSGAGLARTASASWIRVRSQLDPNQSTTVLSNDADHESTGADPGKISTLESDHLSQPEWWLMTRGVTRGPLDLISLCQMRHDRELYAADVIRHGETGLWQKLDDVPLLAAAKSSEGDLSLSEEFRPRRRKGAQPTDDGDRASDDVETEREFNRPGKAWTIDLQKRPNRLKHVWHSIAALVGGTRRLRMLVITLLAVGAINYWWQLPPPAETVYREFKSCRTALQRLQDRRVMGPEWTTAAQGYRPRIQSLVNRIKSRANSRHPAEQALYEAGTLGLLPMLDSPSIFVNTDQAFDKHMQIANDALAGRVTNP